MQITVVLEVEVKTGMQSGESSAVLVLLKNPSPPSVLEKHKNRNHAWEPEGSRGRRGWETQSSPQNLLNIEYHCQNRVKVGVGNGGQQGSESVYVCHSPVQTHKRENVPEMGSHVFPKCYE